MQSAEGAGAGLNSMSADDFMSGNVKPKRGADHEADASQELFERSGANGARHKASGMGLDDIKQERGSSGRSFRDIRSGGFMVRHWLITSILYCSSIYERLHAEHAVVAHAIRLAVD